MKEWWNWVGGVNVCQLQWRIVFLCLMDFGDGGTSVRRTAGGNYEGPRMEMIKGKDIPKTKYQGFGDLVKVLWFFRAILVILLWMCEIVVVTLVIFHCALESECRNRVTMKMKVHVFGGGHEKLNGLNG